MVKDPTQRRSAMDMVQALAAEGELATGLIYIDPKAQDMHHALNTVSVPLNDLADATLCPGVAELAKINQSLR